jgi:hypothetical protein
MMINALRAWWSNLTDRDPYDNVKCSWGYVNCEWCNREDDDDDP